MATADLRGGSISRSDSLTGRLIRWRRDRRAGSVPHSLKEFAGVVHEKDTNIEMRPVAASAHGGRTRSLLAMDWPAEI
jgi:hypothetical protein